MREDIIVVSIIFLCLITTVLGVYINFRKEVAKYKIEEYEGTIIDLKQEIYKLTERLVTKDSQVAHLQSQYDYMVKAYENLKLRKNLLLTDDELDYLRCYIIPFKNQILHISKNEYELENGYEILKFYIKQETGYEQFIELPCFKKGTNFKNLEINKEYTLEELGL